MGTNFSNNDQQEALIEEYEHFLKLEKSLSKNTIDAYRSDLQKLINFLKLDGIGLLDATLDDLQHFAASLHDVGIHARSQARIISGIKSFYHFLAITDVQEVDPSELLEGPKIGKYLPSVLTIEEIDAMIDAIDLSKPEGHRNRAILETLYSCGLRVSELCELRISNLFLKEGFI